jgi:hypothetical protein
MYPGKRGNPYKIPRKKSGESNNPASPVAEKICSKFRVKKTLEWSTKVLKIERVLLTTNTI